jgi:hypothetical protein
MKAKLETQDGKSRYKKCRQTIAPVFGIIKSTMASSVFLSAVSATPPPAPLVTFMGTPQGFPTKFELLNCNEIDIILILIGVQVRAGYSGGALDSGV